LPPTSYFFERGARFVRRFFRALHFSSGARFVRRSFRAVRATKTLTAHRLPSSMWRDQGRTPKKLFHVWSALIGMDGIARQTLFLHF